MILKKIKLANGQEISPQTKPLQEGRVDMELSPDQTVVLAGGEILEERYSIERLIGVGGMSTVYEARDLRFTHAVRRCALKEMYHRSPSQEARQQRVATFEREANMLATLSHPAIPKIYDYFYWQDRIYLVLEFVDGKDLERLIREMGGPLPEDQVISWAVQICDVLTYLHGQSTPIIFRDLKPSNVMVGADGRVMLVDFGIAKIFRSEGRGTLIGTEGYAPPEQYRGTTEPRSDIYALGATLHHLLTGSDPRLEAPFTFSERPPRALNPTLSAEIEAVMVKALSYAPEDRFADARAMREALEACPSSGRVSSSAHAWRFEGVHGGRHRTTTARPLMNATSGAPTAFTSAVWVVSTGDEVRSSPTVAGGRVYIGSYDGNLYSLDAASGRINWAMQTSAGICSTPFVSEHVAIFGSEDYFIYAVDVSTGRLVWRYRTGMPVRSSVRVLDGRAYVGSDDHSLYCLDASTGRLIWQGRTWLHVRSSPALGDGAAFVGSGDGHLFAFDLESGAILWKYHTGGAIISSPRLAGGLVYFGSTDHSIYALEAPTGKLAWRVQASKAVTSSPAWDDGRVYVGSVDTHMYCVEASTGEIQWTFQAPGAITSSPAVNGGLVYFGCIDGHVYCLAGDTGALQWRHKIGSALPSSPAVADGSVFIGCTDHSVYALTARTQEGA